MVVWRAVMRPVTRRSPASAESPLSCVFTGTWNTCLLFFHIYFTFSKISWWLMSFIPRMPAVDCRDI
jgi:hypothetical protein